MLILSEENKRLKGTTHKLPVEIVDAYKNIVMNHPKYVGYSGYEKAKNVYKNGCYVTMEWLKNMKHFFTKHKDESDPDFMLGGGFLVKNFVEEKLKTLTDQTRQQYTQSPTKPRNNASNLTGNKGEKSAKSINISTNLMAGLIPKMESKIFIINNDQQKEIFETIKK